MLPVQGDGSSLTAQLFQLGKVGAGGAGVSQRLLVREHTWVPGQGKLHVPLQPLLPPQFMALQVSSQVHSPPAHTGLLDGHLKLLLQFPPQPLSPEQCVWLHVELHTQLPL